MKFDRTAPCNDCPFRKKSPPGWLGAAEPKEFIAATMQDELMPCHQTVDYQANWWQAEMLSPESKVQHCAGARIFFRNQCKMSKNPRYIEAKKLGLITEVAPSDDVFKNTAEFLAHHGKLKKLLAIRKMKKKLDVPPEDDDTYTCGECGHVFDKSITTGCPECGT